MKQNSVRIKRITLLCLGIFPFAALMLFSFSYPENSKKANVSFQSYSGEDLFAGIYLQKGDFANELKTISKTSLATNKNNSDKLFKEVRKNLLQNDPHFFEKFKEGITSQSHLEVSQTLQNTSTTLFKIYNDIKEKQTKHVYSTTDQGLDIVTDNQDIDLTIDFIFIDQPIAVVVLLMLPLGPPTLPLDREGKPMYDITKQDKLSSQMLVDELVKKFS